MQKVLIFASFFGLLFGAASPVCGQDTSYVYIVRARGSHSHPAVIQTGFRLQGQVGIITALHGVVGRTEIFANNEESGAGGQRDNFNDLVIAKVCVARDLALLTSPALQRDARGLPVEQSGRINAGDLAYVLGHPDGIHLHRKSLKVANPALCALDRLIPNRAVELFAVRKSPESTINVISLDGEVGPGHSGAPLFNTEKRVVGVVDGGLTSGYGIGWAIPISEVKWEDPSERELFRIAELEAGSQLFASVSDSDPVKHDPLQTSRMNDFTFYLLGAHLSGDTLTCDFEVSSGRNDRDIILGVKQTGGIRNSNVGKTEFYDDRGNRYVADSVRIGNQRNPDNGQLAAKIISDTKTPVTFTFREVDPTMKKVKLLDIEGGDLKPFKLDFRDIPVDRGE